MSIEQHTVAVDDVNKRLDVFVAQHVGDTVSRSQVQAWIAAGHVLLNGDVCTRSAQRVSAGDTVVVHVQQLAPDEPGAEKMPLHIVYEDDHLLIVDKPRGTVVHPGAGNMDGTLVNGLLHYRPGLQGVGAAERPGIVHRLDKDTSGLLAVAASRQGYESLTAQFKARTVQRRYVTFVHGIVPDDAFTVAVPIGRDTVRRQRMSATRAGKPATTHFTVRSRYAKATELQAELVTGRTHQIRVHAAYVGHPVIGDTRYGGGQTLFPHGQALHAAWLQLDHPVTGQRLSFASPLPAELAQLQRALTADSQALRGDAT